MGGKRAREPVEDELGACEREDMGVILSVGVTCDTWGK
jgi:hypothetical protein